MQTDILHVPSCPSCSSSPSCAYSCSASSSYPSSAYAVCGLTSWRTSWTLTATLTASSSLASGPSSDFYSCYGRGPSSASVTSTSRVSVLGGRVCPSSQSAKSSENMMVSGVVGCANGAAVILSESGLAGVHTRRESASETCGDRRVPNDHTSSPYLCPCFVLCVVSQKKRWERQEAA